MVNKLFLVTQKLNRREAKNLASVEAEQTDLPRIRFVEKSKICGRNEKETVSERGISHWMGFRQVFVKGGL